VNFLAVIGRIFLEFLQLIGRLALFTGRAVACSVTPPFHLRNVLTQIMSIGYYSLPIVGMTAIFTGAVLALQTFVGGARINAENIVPNIVVLAITRELGPVLGGIMVAARVSSAMAAELGTMRVTEQIDALSTLSTNPFRYLIAPRIIAATLVLAPLVLIADIIGVMGGYVVATGKLDFNGAVYLQNTASFLESYDVISGLVKAAVFGFIIALMGCFHGFYSEGGAEGVGNATTKAVVSACVLILIVNYFITNLFFATT
jgi:phospholipid/cholesterol/gamma-HCH transport system permease protein